MTAAEFIATYGLTMTATPARGNPHMTDRNWEADHWLVTIKRETATLPNLTTHYSTGIGHRKNGKPKAPSLASILESLALDASLANDTFDDWCADMGLDTDSRKALDTYLACQAIATGLRRTLGSAAFADLSHVEW